MLGMKAEKNYVQSPAFLTAFTSLRHQCCLFQGCIGQVDITSAVTHVKHLIPEIEIQEPVALETDKASTATLTEETATNASPLTTKSIACAKESTPDYNTDINTVDKHESDNIEETETGKEETEQSIDSRQEDVHFILNSDTDEEIDINKQTTEEGGEGIETVDIENDIDIETDLSALAADILGPKPPKEATKKD